MKVSNILLESLAAMLSLFAMVEGVHGSYEPTVAAVLVLGLVLSLRSVVSGNPVRPWASHRREAARGHGPVSSLAGKLHSARRGSYLPQAEIASILRSASPQLANEAIAQEVLRPSEGGRRLKGDKYLSELEAGIRVLKNE
jgi:hypothetical protein